MEGTASQVSRAGLAAPAVALVGTAAIGYAFIVWFPALVLYTPVMIFPILVALGCITAEIIAVPQAISVMIKVPGLRTPANFALVALGIGVILTYGLFFLALTG